MKILQLRHFTLVYLAKNYNAWKLCLGITCNGRVEEEYPWLVSADKFFNCMPEGQLLISPPAWVETSL